MITTRIAQPGDVTRIVEICKDSWIKTYPNTKIGLTEKMIEDLFSVERMERQRKSWSNTISGSNPNNLILVAEDDGVLIGYIHSIKTGVIGEVKAIYTDPAYQGRGAGGALMRGALEWMSDCSKKVVRTAIYNKNAIGFYKYFGFRASGRPTEQSTVGNIAIPCIELECIHSGQENTQ